MVFGGGGGVVCLAVFTAYVHTTTPFGTRKRGAALCLYRLNGEGKGERGEVYVWHKELNVLLCVLTGFSFFHTGPCF